jgi:hypothetical protein
MDKRRGSGIFLVLVSLVLLGYRAGMVVTGAVIGGEDSWISWINVVALTFLIVGLGLMATKTLTSKFTQTDPAYYSRRAKEVTKIIGNIQGVPHESWISKYEANGILNELRDQGYVIEYGDDLTAFEIGNAKGRHVTIQQPGKGFRKHLLITDNPYDSRLKSLGLVEDHGKMVRVPSSYTPDHARSSGKETLDFLNEIKLFKK